MKSILPLAQLLRASWGIRRLCHPTSEIPEPLGPGGPGFYGAKYAPFTIETDPVEPDFAVRDLNLPAGVDQRRFELRRKLLRGVQGLETRHPPPRSC